jgi:Rieske Fe-S protein
MKSPAGDNVLITRQGQGEAAGDFIALSSTCPHLGCRVHWESAENRFFCPCHNGTFDRGGSATGGPPAAEHKNLPRYPLRVENGLLFINVPLRAVPIGQQLA